MWCVICSFLWCAGVLKFFFFSFWQGKENSRLLRYAFCFHSTCFYIYLCHVISICNSCKTYTCKPVASLIALFFHHLREQERYLLRIQELETVVARLGEESIDRATLLESVQSDKETISRSGGARLNWKLQFCVSLLE